MPSRRDTAPLAHPPAAPIDVTPIVVTAAANRANFFLIVPS
jgi:hypothetical protein